MKVNENSMNTVESMKFNKSVISTTKQKKNSKKKIT